MAWEDLQRDILEDFADLSISSRQPLVMEARFEVCRLRHNAEQREYQRQPYVRRRIHAYRRRLRRELWVIRAAQRMPDPPPLPSQVIGACRRCPGKLELRMGCRNPQCTSCGTPAPRSLLQEGVSL